MQEDVHWVSKKTKRETLSTEYVSLVSLHLFLWWLQSLSFFNIRMEKVEKEKKKWLEKTHRLKITLKEYWQNCKRCSLYYRKYFSALVRHSRRDIGWRFIWGIQRTAVSPAKLPEDIFKNYWTSGRKNRKVGQEKGNTTWSPFGDRT